ncbi:Cell wall assembly regulator [Marasmius crinis-equi]|uniref:Cell wall assembly regulator n=1 Tax=Marasmius crinis-equi TaxID=585013 RepID=A0ABR3F806_9AGAR
MHHDQLHTPMSPSSSYPPLETTWNRLKLWLSREYPELGDTLNYGILPQDLAQIELQFGFPLPAVVRESYLIVDGQEAESAAGCAEGLFFGLTLLPLEEVLDEWRFWREVDEDPTTGANAQLRQHMGSIPPGWIRREYSQRGWIPLIADKAGNYIGVDVNPGESGVPGQVVVFGRDFDTKVVLYHGDGSTGWAKWLASFVDDLESGDGYEIGGGNDSGDDSEDEIGYESYFYDGTGRGQGDGGGDTTVSLRLTGEYKGWNVMEAWADRSVRKWYESGVISEKVANEKDKVSDTPSNAGLSSQFTVSQEKVDMKALDLNQAAAEVAIPVLADTDVPGADITDHPPSPVEQAPSHKVSPSESRKAPPNLPTISVTKPPVPLPVELPTPREINGLPSPPDSTHSSFEEDLEAGRKAREPTLPQSRSPTSPTNTVRQATSPVQGPLPASNDQEDLLADSEPLQEITPITETSSPLPPITDVPLSGEPGSIAVDSIEAKAEGEADPDVTIRLVGGGGSSGVVSDVAADDSENVTEELSTGETIKDTDTQSIHSVTSESGSGKEVKKHKKTKSGLAGLKKLGQLGRKKDSVSSMKEAAASNAEST